MLSALSAAAVAAGVAMAVVPPARRYVPAATILAAGVSLGVTVFYLARGSGRSSELLLVEAIGMVVLIFLTVRHGPPKQAAVAAALALVAGVAMIVPDPPPDDPVSETFAGIAFWSLFGFGAVAAAVYVNALEARRARSVAEARRAQRLELARDLHDFVAHDVSGIVVEAQAAQVVAERDPTGAAAALSRIEAAGLAALESMDRSLRALHEVDGVSTDAEGDSPRAERRRYGLEDLPEVVERFAATSTVEARLKLEQDVIGELAPEASHTAYRVAVEALTNVRRHAPNATRVDVVVEREGDAERAALVLAVVDDGSGGQAPAPYQVDRKGGSGLLGLRERVEALGGTFAAGRSERGGWEVRAVLPLARKATVRPAR